MNPQRIMDLANAFYGSCVLFRAVDAGVFNHLARTGGDRVGPLAEALGLHPRAARLLLDACVALDLLVKDGDTYQNSAEAAVFLVSGAPGDLSSALRYNRDVYPLWGRLDAFLQSGTPVERPEMHLGEDPERTRTFVEAMHGRAMAIGRAVIPSLPLRGNEQILDLGGGSGAYSILAAKAHPEVRATVLDLPDIVAVAKPLIEKEGLGDRIACHADDYHTSEYPGDNDAVFLFGMLHQESPESIRRILKQAHASLRPGGWVAVLDLMTDATRCRPPFSALFALNMALTADHGWVFSDDDLREWSDAAGFVDFTCRPVPPPMPHWLAEARKPPAS